MDDKRELEFEFDDGGRAAAARKKRVAGISKPNIGKGDYGFTDFIGTAVAYKSSWQAEACGSVDELNTFIGEAHARTRDASVKKILMQISRDLFVLGTDIANTMMTNRALPRITPEHIHQIEDWILHFEKPLKPIRHFVLPVGPPQVTVLHQARAVCRRAERQMVKFVKDSKKQAKVNPLTLAYLNRLGDLLFTLSRAITQKLHQKEVFWSRADFKTPKIK